MKCNIILVITMILLTGCNHQKRTVTSLPRMTNDVVLKTTPVKDQGKSSLCWAYAMLATIETEHLMQGDSINLSADYVARMYLKEQAIDRLISDKRQKHDISTRGMMTGLVHLIENYGLTHYDAYHRDDKCNYNVLARRLQITSDRAWSLDELSRHIDPQLDNNIYPLAKKVFMYGAIYTPLEFAHSVYHPAEYTFYTSFTHHPFGEPFVMESPDNHYHDAFLNIPIDTLMNKIVNSIRKGHPVCWEGDISEPYFNYSAGIAQLPHGRNVNQELRQEDFNNRETTDDHCMEIMGLAHDAHGNRYFIMKNSWGDRNPLKGFMYVSYDYVKLKTVAVAMKER